MAREQREKLARILRVLVEKETVTPGDVVVETGLPRYEVLAAFHFLEALGVVRLVYWKGSYKIYTGTEYARLLLEALEAESPLEHLASMIASRQATTIPVGVSHEGEAVEAA
ncbi:hypothetical protein Pyrfu_0021 [Pyrolobus fumarii 1A]|uniref:Uncharacterized protein n=1 Tax=Pyrolobus fumarii (strain DSM 11204 / 1A) TaxID=694429 RepID=G0EDQ6_PYRF1|nr:hypothetical protein [Pyrolobus fumarii]AEM37893.1 hypothetical protein Pyrfu_0021 [Pyrolobus fumarii 1A]